MSNPVAEIGRFFAGSIYNHEKRHCNNNEVLCSSLNIHLVFGIILTVLKRFLFLIAGPPQLPHFNWITTFICIVVILFYSNLVTLDKIYYKITDNSLEIQSYVEKTML